jgi:hypothetical protein
VNTLRPCCGPYFLSYDDIIGITADGQGVNGYQGYLGTPSGQFKVYDPATRKTTLLK